MYGGIALKRKFIYTLVIIVLAMSMAGCENKISNDKDSDSLSDAAERVELALGDEYKKQSETVIAGTLKYGDEEGKEILYHVLKTTYYEADPNEVTGLNTDALGVLFNPESANKCTEMMIKEWNAALYEFDECSFLCWTDSPEVSYVLEYNPDEIPDSEILKMAESAEKTE